MHNHICRLNNYLDIILLSENKTTTHSHNYPPHIPIIATYTPKGGNGVARLRRNNYLCTTNKCFSKHITKFI